MFKKIAFILLSLLISLTLLLSPITPVSAGADVIFGLNGGDSFWNNTGNVLELQRFTNTVGAGALTKLEVLINSAASGGEIRIGIYADNNGLPGGRLLDAGEAEVTTGWVGIGNLNYYLTPGINYWLGFILQNANAVAFQSGRSGNPHYWTPQPYGPLPAFYNPAGGGNNFGPYVMRASVNLITMTGWYVSPAGNDSIGDGSRNRPFRTIQAAINKAYGGNTIHVLPGTYNENLVIIKDLTIIGESGNPADTVINGQNSEPVIKKTGTARCTLKNLTVQNGKGDGIYSKAAWHGSQIAIVSELKAENLIVRNNAGRGIASESGKLLSVERCDIGFNGGDGIFSEEVVVNLKQNQIHDNSGKGISVLLAGMSSNQPGGLIEQNRIWQNKLGGIQERMCSGLIIQNNEVADNVGGINTGFQ